MGYHKYRVCHGTNVVAGVGKGGTRIMHISLLPQRSDPFVLEICSRIGYFSSRPFHEIDAFIIAIQPLSTRIGRSANEADFRSDIN